MRTVNLKTVHLLRRPSDSPMARTLATAAAAAAAAAASSSSSPPSPSSFMVGYLMDRIGYTQEQAATVARRLPHITSPEKPDAVLHFLRSAAGLSPQQIRRFIRCHPVSLAADVHATLLPKVQLLASLLPPSDRHSKQLARLVAACAASFSHSIKNRLAPNLEFLRSLLGGENRKVVSVLCACPRLLGADLDKVLRRNLAILRGRPGLNVAALVLKSPFVLVLTSDQLENVFRTAEEALGVRPSSPDEYIVALHLSALLPREAFLRKLEIIRSYGLSNYEMFTMLRRCPLFLRLTEEHMRRKLDFLLIRTVSSTKALLSNTWQLLFSLESRLVPRYELLRSLQLRGLLPSKVDFPKAFAVTQKKFNEDYVYKFSIGEGSDLVQSFMRSPAYVKTSPDPSIWVFNN